MPLAALLFAGVGLAAQSPDDERWVTFTQQNPGRPRIPEDEEMGPLADDRNPDPATEGALELCERVFAAINRGETLPEAFLSATAAPLVQAMEQILEKGARRAAPRYGKPLRNGDRVDVPVRLEGISGPVYGRIYLLRVDGLWLIDQWAVDLTDLPLGEPALPSD